MKEVEEFLYYWKLVAAFPMTVTGKIQKFRTRELATEELELAAERASATQQRVGQPVLV